ncbi:hypothetical protein AB6A40_004563, partial [Gnathostoma spinigerum]
FTSGLITIIRCVLTGISDENERATFILFQVIRDRRHLPRFHIGIKPRRLVQEISGKGEGTPDDTSHMRYGSISLTEEPKSNASAIDDAARLDEIILAVIETINSLSQEERQLWTIRVLTKCVDRWRNSFTYKAENYEHACRFVPVCHEGETDPLMLNDDESNLKVQYLMAQMQCLLSDMDFSSTASLVSIADVAQVLLESSIKRIKEKIDRLSTVDVLCAPTPDDQELISTEIKTIEMAVAVVGGIIINGKMDNETKHSLSLVASNLTTLVMLADQYGETYCKDITLIAESCNQLLEVLQSVNILPVSSCGPSSPRSLLSSNPVTLSEHKQEIDRFSKICRDLDDPLEPVQGHALIVLSQAIRKRDENVICYLNQHSDIMDRLISKLMNKDSYVYLLAINTMAELAYWSRDFFDQLVDFFVEPSEKLKHIMKENKELELSDMEISTFLVIQRVKIGEALAKVCRSLGDMAPWHFNRIIGPLLACFYNSSDEQFKASSLSAISDLIIACQGRSIGAYLRELLSIVDSLLKLSKDSIVRRAVMTLLRAIIVTHSTDILEELSSELRDIHRLLKQLLRSDRDETVRLYAELCLIDIKEQMDKSVLDASDSLQRKVNI